MIELSARITQVLIGRHPLVSLREKQVSPDASYMLSTPVDELRAELEGIVGDRHAGFVKQSDGRTPQYARGTSIRNTRQVSLVSEEDLTTMAERMGIPVIEAAWIGANLVVQGVPHFSWLPPMTRLYFPGAATVTLEGECGPCAYPGTAIAHRYPDRTELARQFPKGALHLRGVVGWVERAGTIRTGDAVKVVVPEHTSYPPASA